MGNFMRRTIAFILGMIFMLVVIVGGVAGVAYWSFKNLTIGQLNITEEDSEMSSWTIEDLTSFIIDISNNPSSVTLKLFEEKGFNVEELLGLDFSNANPNDVESLKSLALASLSGPNGLYEIDMGVVFLFLPKNEETGAYPIFSEGARNRLRQFTVGDLINPDYDGNLGAVNVLRSMSLGSILSGTYYETYENGEYVYSCDDKGLDLFGNVQFGLITDLFEGQEFDIGYEIMEGKLQNLKSKTLREIIASFGATDEETYQNNLEMYSLLGDVGLSDLFVYNEETSAYDFDFSSIMSFATVGLIMGGYSACTKDSDCPVHEYVTDCDGELYQEGEIYQDSGISKLLMKKLANLQLMELMGYDFNTLFDDIYLGEMFNYTITYPTDECEVDCTLVHEHKYYSFCKPNCTLTHSEHNYYFEDKFGYVGDMLNDICNKKFEEITSGNFDIMGIIEDTTIGEVMGYKQIDGEWYDEYDEPVDKSGLAGKIFYQLYGKKVNELSNVAFKDLVQGITLGEVLGYTKCTATEYGCPVHTENCNQTEPYWYNGTERASKMYNSLSNVELSTLTTNPQILEDTLSTLFVGDLMGYDKSGGIWLKNGVEISAIEAILADIGLGSIFNGEFDLQSKIDELKISDIVNVENNAILSLVGDSTVLNLPSRLQSIYVGEIMGYRKSGSVWFDGNNQRLDGIKLKLAKLTVEELSNGGFESLIDDIIVSDVIDDYTTGVFSLIDDAGNVKLSEITSVLSDAVKTATFYDLLEAGLLEDNGLSQRLDNKLGAGTWHSSTITEIIDALLRL